MKREIPIPENLATKRECGFTFLHISLHLPMERTSIFLHFFIWKNKRSHPPFLSELQIFNENPEHLVQFFHELSFFLKKQQLQLELLQNLNEILEQPQLQEKKQFMKKLSSLESARNALHEHSIENGGVNRDSLRKIQGK